jgi:hypothetical protein
MKNDTQIMGEKVDAILPIVLALLMISAPVSASTAVQSANSATAENPSTSSSNIETLPTSIGSGCQEINGHKYCVKDVWAESDEVRPGETVTIKAVVKNEGSKKGTISTYLGVRPPGETKSYPDGKKEYDIGVGERVTLTYEYQVPENNPTGEYEVTVDVWTGNDAEMFHSSGWQQVFDVVEPTTGARIADFDVDNGEFEQGETVDAEVTVENTGDTDHTLPRFASN